MELGAAERGPPRLAPGARGAHTERTFLAIPPVMTLPRSFPPPAGTLHPGPDDPAPGRLTPRRPGRARRRRTVLVAALAAALAACAGADEAGVALGPVDGRELPPADTGRVAVGDAAPDFALESYEGPVVRLSDFRGEREVILVFYRGHW